MDEPVYEFVKGVGWVPNGKPPHPTFTGVSRCGRYRLTMEAREPGPGERFFADFEVDLKKLEKAFAEVSGYDMRNEWGGLYEDYLWQGGVRKAFDGFQFIVFKKELIE
jgi:hypothetical protein